MNDNRNHNDRRPWSLWTVVALLAFLGVSAVLPGWALFTDPSGASMGMSTDWLNNPIFPNYLIPGLFLFFVVGLGSLCVATVLLVRPHWRWAQSLNPFRGMDWAWTVALGLGVAVMCWIIIQVLSVTLYSWLQPTVFGIGLAIVILMLEPKMRRYFALPAAYGAQAMSQQ